MEAEEFYKISHQSILIDVRSEAEFLQGHIPNAINLPLFTNAERKIVGTIYKQIGKKEAIQKGLEIVGPKLAVFTQTITDLNPENKPLAIYCWRGGMRSNSMAWLFRTAGYNCSVLKGGYKNFRNYVLHYFENPFLFKMLSAKTGSAKTEIIKILKSKGSQIIDLEAIANHKGSAFGAIGENTQPSTEHFENLLFSKLYDLDPEKITWIESESRMVGSIIIPESFWKQMNLADVIHIERDFEFRVKFLVEVYGNCNIQELIDSTHKITKRLGGVKTNEILIALNESNLLLAAQELLIYYDKYYNKFLEKRKIQKIEHYKMIDKTNDEIADFLFKMYK